MHTKLSQWTLNMFGELILQINFPNIRLEYQYYISAHDSQTCACTNKWGGTASNTNDVENC